MSTSLNARLCSIEQKRLKSKPLSQAVAPSISSREFRIQGSNSKSQARRWDRFFSTESASRGTATLKNVSSGQTKPGTVSLGTARPHPQHYPWSLASFESPALDGLNRSAFSDDKVLTAVTKESKGYSLALALNYGFASGSGHLLRFVSEHVELLHDPPYQDWETCLTCGTSSALDIIFRMLLDRGEPLIVEEHTYSGTIEAAKALGLELVCVSMDKEGLSSQHLEQILQDRSRKGHKVPSVLYTIPCGHNPTGTTQSYQRRKDVYGIAEMYGLIIIEDDPYHLLQLDPDSQSYSGKDPIQRYLDRLPRSLLSMDTSGRVIRLETTSKILAPGLRCGWLVASSQIVQKFISHTDCSTIAVSGPTQLMLTSLLDQNWGHAGFLRWLNHLSGEYRIRRDKLLACCSMYLPKNVCSWSVPTEGMFLWIELRIDRFRAIHSGPGSGGTFTDHVLDVENRIYESVKAAGVTISKGSWFMTLPSQKPNELHFRLTFAAAEVESFDHAISVFAASITEVLDNRQ